MRGKRVPVWVTSPVPTAGNCHLTGCRLVNTLDPTTVFPVQCYCSMRRLIDEK